MCLDGPLLVESCPLDEPPLSLSSRERPGLFERLVRPTWMTQLGSSTPYSTSKLFARHAERASRILMAREPLASLLCDGLDEPLDIKPVDATVGIKISRTEFTAVRGSGG